MFKLSAQDADGRNTRSFTAPTEMPKATAISSWGRSSIKASVAATRSFTGNRQNACRIFSRVSC